MWKKSFVKFSFTNTRNISQNETVRGLMYYNDHQRLSDSSEITGIFSDICYFNWSWVTVRSTNLLSFFLSLTFYFLWHLFFRSIFLSLSKKLSAVKTSCLSLSPNKKSYYFTPSYCENILSRLIQYISILWWWF